MSRSWYLAAFIAALSAFAWPEASPSPGPFGSRLGFRFDLETGGEYSPSYGADQDALPAGEYSFGLGSEFTWGRWIPLRSKLDFFWVGASEWSEDLFRYRAFHGLRWSAETGARFSLGRLELDLLAGGALSAARYDDLSIVTAYPSVVGEARLLVPMAIRGLRGFSLEASLLVEYMWRGTARTISAGIELGASLALGKAGK